MGVKRNLTFPQQRASDLAFEMFPPDTSRGKSAAPSHSCGYKAQSIIPPQAKGQQRSRHTVAVLASLPGWLTILFADQNDSAWLTFSLYCPGFAVPGAHQLAQCGQLEIWRIVNSFSFVRRYFICQLVDRLSHLAGSSI